MPDFIVTKTDYSVFKGDLRSLKQKLHTNVIEFTQPKEIANAFNTYFASVGCNLAEMIECVDSNPMAYLKTPLKNSFHIARYTI